MTRPAIVCNGRALDANQQPVGEPCGRTPDPPRPPTLNPVTAARAGGWRIGPPRPDGSRDAMCPRCAKPDPELAKLLRELTR